MTQVTAARWMPALGWDPCPGSVAGTRALAGEVTALAGRVEAVRHRTVAPAVWVGSCAAAYAAEVDVLAAVALLLADAAGEVGRALSGWAEELSGLQARADALEAECAATTAERHRTAGGRARAYYGYGGGLTTDAAEEAAVLAWEAALAADAEVRARADRLHAEYTDRAQAVAQRMASARYGTGSEVWALAGAAPALPGPVGAASGLAPVVGAAGVELWRRAAEDGAAGWVRGHARTIDDVGDGAGYVADVFGLAPTVPTQAVATGASAVSTVAQVTVALGAEGDGWSAAVGAAGVVAGPLGRAGVRRLSPAAARALVREEAGGVDGRAGRDASRAAEKTSRTVDGETELLTLLDDTDVEPWDREGFVGTAWRDVDEVAQHEQDLGRAEAALAEAERAEARLR